MQLLYQEELPISGQMLAELTGGVIARGKLFRFRAHGSSMFPFIRDEDVITLAPPGNRRPRIGDVVAFIRPGTYNLVVHRVTGRSSQAFYIQGDNCEGAGDGWVPASALVGVVTRVERSGRRRRLGLGLESWLIALLSRLGILRPLVGLAIGFRNAIIKARS